MNLCFNSEMREKNDLSAFASIFIPELAVGFHCFQHYARFCANIQKTI